MKKLIMAAIAAMAASANCADLGFVIKSTNDLVAIKSIPGWEQGVNTNSITISVCVGGIDTEDRFVPIPLGRDLTFNSEGRLIKVSPLWVMSSLTDRLDKDNLTFDSLIDQLVRFYEREKIWPRAKSEKEAIELEKRLQKIQLEP
jgi:hypothetical protein